MSACQSSNVAGGRTGEDEIDVGKKLNCTKGISPRVVSACSPAKVGRSSRFGVAVRSRVSSTPYAELRLSVGVVFSFVPLLSAPKKRTAVNAPGEAARLSRSGANEGSASQSTSKTPTMLNSSVRTGGPFAGFAEAMICIVSAGTVCCVAARFPVVAGFPACLPAMRGRLESLLPPISPAYLSADC